MQLPYFAILAAAAASWAFGAVWYGAFGRAWAAGLDLLRPGAAEGARSAPPVFALVLSFVAELAMSATLAGVLIHIAGAQFSMKSALVAGVLVWLGFIAPTVVTSYAYQGRPWTVSAIDGGHWLGVMLIQAAALALLV